TLGVAEILNRLKGKSSGFFVTRSRRYGPGFRCSGPASYFAATVGSISEETIRRHIKNQKGK
ncbi:hypothetical protein, partial [Azospirillum endophyticum]